ncbi:uncharacterized protein LOC132747635 [Ruditapes philippinarum]|uniref:uncharacterized protein LOC132747635 n=1 Tax=Ruditapes philippinarum TaxID=129788 RepID=UPI00295B25D5|nr:uncharacterized protein LOC132747635 [Ruditapes philippinarum]
MYCFLTFIISENKALVQRLYALNQSLRNKDIAIIAISVALGIVIVILIIVLSCYIGKKHNRRTIIYDEESPEGDDRSLLKNDVSDNSTNLSEQTELKEFDVKSDSTEDLHERYNVNQRVTTTEDDTDQQSATTSEGDIQQKDGASSDGGSSNIGLSGTSQAQGMEHSPGRHLSNIPATNTKGCNKIAIKRNDVSHQHA